MTTNAGLVEPAYHTAPTYTRTLGPEVGELCELIGFGPDPEQQLILDDLFALDGRGKSAAFEEAIIAPRQNLKTGVIKQAALGWLFVTDQRLVVWSAHEFRTAQEAFRDMEELVAGSPMLAKRVKSIYRGNGDEAIELISGARLIFKARTKGGGRGLTGNKIILDEAFALIPAHMGALLPTLSAVPDPQVIYASSAGDSSAAVLRGIRDRGRIGDPRMAYAEWCAPHNCADGPLCDHALNAVGCALDNVDNLKAANSAIGRRITLAHVQAERRAMPPLEYARERLGWWEEAAGAMVVPAESWAADLDLFSELVTPPEFALDVNPARSYAAISAAGFRADGLPHVEVTSSTVGSALITDHRPGTDWVVDRCVQLQNAWPSSTLWVGSGSAAESLVPALVEAGVRVGFIGSGDVMAACGLFYDKAIASGLRHIGQKELTTALTVARKTSDDSEGAWRWGRRRSASDITPLYAATLALWAAITSQSTANDPAFNVW